MQLSSIPKLRGQPNRGLGMAGARRKDGGGGEENAKVLHLKRVEMTAARSDDL